MKKLDLTPFKTLSSALRMKGENAQTGQTQANYRDRPREAASYGGEAHGFLTAANELDKIIYNMEKE
jgi:hypothetical protein